MSGNGVSSVRRALLSVSDKTGIVELAGLLASRGIEIISTGGTSRLLRGHGVAVTEVADYTGFPEIMDGRVRTLHPKVHGGLLGRGERDAATASEHGIGAIDLLVVNLYPFERTVSRAGVAFEEAIENIDVGGPAMIRAASKNHRYVTVVVDPADYDVVGREIRERGGISRRLRSELAVKAFKRTAAYDAAIAGWLARAVAGAGGAGSGRRGDRGGPGEASAARSGEDEAWPETLELSLRRVSPLRYGENHHQEAAFYAEAGAVASGLAGAGQLQGKALSYNNIADASTACECVHGFDMPACVIVKHANPCGAACAGTSREACLRAVAADPESAFGGIFAFNRALDAETAREIVGRQFVEVVIAPGVEKSARAVLGEKPALRVLVCAAPDVGGREYRSVLGGVLAQERDRGEVSGEGLKVVTRKPPSRSEVDELLFAWRVVKFVKSNAIVFARAAATVGIGAGQTSRVGSVRIAAAKSRARGFGGEPLVMASDGFFPFRDGLDVAVEAGVAAVIQPGGSAHDGELIAAANEHGIAMVFTGARCFRH